MVRICLIEPRSPSYHVFSEYKLPRLGLPLIGAVLKNLGHDVIIFCEEITSLDLKEVLGSDLVGISTTTSTAPGAYVIADKIRAKNSSIPIVIGGVHASFLPEEALLHADYVVRKEGEQTIAELIEYLENDSIPLSKILGLSYHDGAKICHNPDRPPLLDLDSLPFPDLGLVVGNEKVRITPIATSRGCPFDCSFCSVTTFWGKKYRFRSTENVIQEIREKKPQQVLFYDDNFTANISRTKNLLNVMIKEGITPAWSAQARTDVARDKELLGLMKKSGCFLLQLGLESINPETLKIYNKHQEVKDIIESIKTLRKFGIRAHGMFVFGSDGDDVQTIYDTARFALHNKIFTVQFLVLTPLPGSKLYSELDSQGRIYTKDWALYDGHKVVFEPAKMAVYQLQKASFKAMKKFYSWWQCAKLFISFRFVSWYFRSRVGYKTVKKWWKKNKYFVKSCKKLSLKH
jgi:radical SAM superfamily enzyme YgiQ (UPF0313 family)